MSERESFFSSCLPPLGLNLCQMVGLRLLLPLRVMEKQLS